MEARVFLHKHKNYLSLLLKKQQVYVMLCLYLKFYSIFVVSERESAGRGNI